MLFIYFSTAILFGVVIVLAVKLRSSQLERNSIKADFERLRSMSELAANKSKEFQNGLLERLSSTNASYEAAICKENELRENYNSLSIEFELLKAHSLKLKDSLDSVTESFNASSSNEEELIKLNSALASNLEVLRIEKLEVRDKLNSVTGNYNSVVYERDELHKQYELLSREYELLKSRNSHLEEHVKTLEELEVLKRNLAAFETEHELVAAGLYPLYVPYETPDALKNQLEEKRLNLAAMIRSKTAAICSTKWTINGTL